MQAPDDVRSGCLGARGVVAIAAVNNAPRDAERAYIAERLHLAPGCYALIQRFSKINISLTFESIAK